MPRSVPEWIGKTDDDPIPARVRLRVFDRYDGRDYITGVKIRIGDAWDVEHKIALCNGGEHRESNMAPILKQNHKAKTREDLAIKKKTAQVRKKFLGITKPKKQIQSRGFGTFVSNSKDVNDDLKGVE